MSAARHAVVDVSVARQLGRASVRAGARIAIAASPGQIWTELVAVDAWGDWYHGVTNVRGEGPLAHGSRFRFKAGPASISAVVDRLVIEEELGFTGTSRGSTTAYLFQLEPAQDGTTVTAAQTMGGLAARTMKPVLQGVTEKAVVRWLDALKHRVEA
jgi:hypothetical protein